MLSHIMWWGGFPYVASFRSIGMGPVVVWAVRYSIGSICVCECLFRLGTYIFQLVMEEARRSLSRNHYSLHENKVGVRHQFC